jgi:hypothetical protein
MDTNGIIHSSDPSGDTICNLYSAEAYKVRLLSWVVEIVGKLDNRIRMAAAQKKKG